MRAEEELMIGKALSQQWEALTSMGAERAERNGGRMSDVVVFERLVDGCLFTLRYTANQTPGLSVVHSLLTDHRLN